MYVSFSALKTPILSATRLYHHLRSRGKRVDVTTEDWDTLVILDACRYDMFERLNTLPGTLESRLSLGSATDEFIRENFGSETYNDIVYVTANPRVNTSLEGQFHRIINVWEDGWDSDLQTVPPKTIADETVRANDRYPNKRIVSHFIQPHAPFIGEFGRKHFKNHSTLSNHVPDIESDENTSGNIWTLLRHRDVEIEAVKRAYEENLKITLPHVARIREAEPGKTVVTSDHGNLLGERISPFMRRFYGHPSRFQAPALIRVPWLEHDGGDRRDITTDQPESETTTDIDDAVEEKLEHLGYA